MAGPIDIRNLYSDSCLKQIRFYNSMKVVNLYDVVKTPPYRHLDCCLFLNTKFRPDQKLQIYEIQNTASRGPPRMKTYPNHFFFKFTFQQFYRDFVYLFWCISYVVWKKKIVGFPDKQMGWMYATHLGLTHKILHSLFLNGPLWSASDGYINREWCLMQSEWHFLKIVNV